MKVIVKFLSSDKVTNGFTVMDKEIFEHKYDASLKKAQKFLDNQTAKAESNWESLCKVIPLLSDYKTEEEKTKAYKRARLESYGFSLAPIVNRFEDWILSQISPFKFYTPRTAEQFYSVKDFEERIKVIEIADQELPIIEKYFPPSFGENWFDYILGRDSSRSSEHPDPFPIEEYLADPGIVDVIYDNRESST